MAAQEAQAEPSMEEILASIRRIISEEDQPAASAEPALELTQPAEKTDDLLVFEEEEQPAPVAVAPAPQPAPVAAAPAPQPAPVEPPPARIVEISAPVAEE